ncbi:unnamed protein product, partial [Rhizoctonia solani]
MDSVPCTKGGGFVRSRPARHIQSTTRACTPIRPVCRPTTERKQTGRRQERSRGRDRNVFHRMGGPSFAHSAKPQHRRTRTSYLPTCGEPDAQTFKPTDYDSFVH